MDRPCGEDMNLTHQLLSCALPSTTAKASHDHISPKEEPPDVYQLILSENLNELFQLKWNEPDILSLESKFMSPEISNNISSLKTALLIIETIVTNGISLQTHIDRIVKTITKRPVGQWMDELNKIVDEQGKAKSVQVLLAELARENPSLNIKKLEQRYREVMDYYAKEIFRWTSTDIQQESMHLDESKKIAIIIQAAHLHKKYRPRDIQILSLLLLIDNSDQGRLAQIRTGEGKSIIVSMCKYLSMF